MFFIASKLSEFIPKTKKYLPDILKKKIIFFFQENTLSEFFD